tara:strand:- start:787 stop:1278 length:492 start_codon:yes stop_codon:yes gene_type:complete
MITLKNILSIFLIITLCSCNNNKEVFIEFKGVEGGWEKKDKINFNFYLQEKGNYDISIILRSDEQYPFSNIYFDYQLTSKMVNLSESKMMNINDSNTNWYSKRVLSISNNIIELKKNLLLNEGNVILSLEHSVRFLDSINPILNLEGILDIGLLVKKSNDEKI